MKKYVVALIGLVALGLIIVPKIALSQFDGSCPVLIQDALERVEQICTATGRNQVCYANSWTEAEPQASITDFSFELGDITDLLNIRTLRLGGLNTETDEWGMVLMRLQANVPASLPGRNVLFLLFGDVQLDDQDDAMAASPMQAVQLRTGVGGPGCSEAPPSGLLVQTPHGVGRVLLQVNGVDVSLGSTVFFTAQANGFLTVSTLEGSALVHANGGWSAALPGTQVRVPMSADLSPAGPPSLPEPYTFDEMLTLPMSPLEREVEVLPALDAPDLELLQQAILGGGLPDIGDFSDLSLDLTQPSNLYISTSSLISVPANAVTNVTGTVSSTLNTVNDVATQTLNTAGEVVTNTTTAVVDTTVNTVNNTLDTTQNLVNDALPEQVSQPVNQVVDTTQTVVTDVASTTTDTATTTVNTTTETVDDVANQTQQVVDQTGEAVQDILPPLFGQ